MQNYNTFQKLLHQIVLGNNLISKSLYEIEKIIFLKEKNFNESPHIFISGLPRSGTTSILNFIYSSNKFGSLKYLNMPFILSPNLSKIINQKNIIKKERLHSDGIKYDLNSPEAFDEFFFKNDKEFIKSELLNYISLVLRSEKKSIYLSKNNLNYKRINLISSILPKSIFLIPIREPLQHAYSLLNQHINFINLQKNDDFVRKYMSYLSHNEFGLDHCSWYKPIYYKNFENINYWLEQWLFFYKQIFERYKAQKNCIFVTYEKLTDHRYLRDILKKINLNEYDNLNLNFFKNLNKSKIKIDFDKEIYENAINLYNDFKQIDYNF